MKSFGLVLLLILFSPCYGQKDPALLKIGVDNTSKKKLTPEQINRLNLLIGDTSFVDAKTGVLYSRIAIRESKKIEYVRGEVDGMHNLCKALVFSNQTDSALFYAKLSLDIAEKAKDGKLQVQAHNVIAGVLSLLGHHDLAADEYFLNIELAEKYDPNKVATTYANLGHVFRVINNIKKSREYSEIGYDLAKKKKDTTIMLMTLNLLGLNDYHENKFRHAISYYEEALIYAQAAKNLQRRSQVLYNMGNAYFELKDYERAFDLYYESIEINQGNETYSSTAIGFHGLAEAYQEVKQLKKAKSLADSALYYAEKGDNMEIIMESYSLKARIENELGNFSGAYKFLDAAYAYKDSMNLAQLNAAALDAEDEFNKKKEHIKDSLLQVQHEMEVVNERKVNEQKLKTRDTLIWIIGLVLAVVTLGIYFLYKNMKLVQMQKDLVSSQKEEIQEQHNEIKDSINYAKRIQDAIISKASGFDKISKENFVLFLPKNVVSGDFYWSHTFDNGDSIWAVGDCTGHGVPGAFMSLLGIGFLNEIVIEQGILDPGTVLDQLRAKIIKAIQQKDETTTSDGMDIGICYLHKSSGVLSYAGANNALWLIKTNSLLFESNDVRKFNTSVEGYTLFEILPDKMPIGNYFKSPPPFRTKKVQVEENDLIVLFSDGFADQFGGSKGKKFKYSPLKQLFVDNAQLPMEEINSIVRMTFDNWKGSEEQVDDVCIVAIKITL